MVKQRSRSVSVSGSGSGLRSSTGDEKTAPQNKKESPSLLKLGIWTLLIFGIMNFFGKYVQENIWGFGMVIGTLIIFLEFNDGSATDNIPVVVKDDE